MIREFLLTFVHARISDSDPRITHPNVTKLSEEILSQKGRSGIISHSPEGNLRDFPALNRFSGANNSGWSLRIRYCQPLEKYFRSLAAQFSTCGW